MAKDITQIIETQGNDGYTHVTVIATDRETGEQTSATTSYFLSCDRDNRINDAIKEVLNK